MKDLTKLYLAIRQPETQWLGDNYRTQTGQGHTHRTIPAYRRGMQKAR